MWLDYIGREERITHSGSNSLCKVVVQISSRELLLQLHSEDPTLGRRTQEGSEHMIHIVFRMAVEECL